MTHSKGELDDHFDGREPASTPGVMPGAGGAHGERGLPSSKPQGHGPGCTCHDAVAELQRFRLAVENANDMVVITDARRRIEYVNPAFRRITGWAMDEVRGRKPGTFLHGPKTDPSTVERLKKALNRGDTVRDVHLLNYNKQGGIYWVSLNILPVRDASNRLRHYVAVQRDITDQRAIEGELRTSSDRLDYLTSHDQLTGLANRERFKSALADTMVSVQRLGGILPIILIDLDRFKLINDSLGHHVGDEVLIEMARRLQGCVRGSDVVARLGGDEFALLFGAVQETDFVDRMCRKIGARLAEPVVIQGTVLHTSGSLGVSLYPQDADSVDELLRNADTAMYQAKARGRNTVCFFSHELSTHSRARFERESLLRLALPRRELLLYFQPQILANNGQLVGFEALLRWNCAQLGLVPPDEFIPLAEDTGLIVDIGDWVLEQACRQWVVWRMQHGAALRVSVNLSAHQLRDQGLVSRIAGLMAQHGVPHEVIELELTESVAMHDPTTSIQTMRGLREIGVSLAVDDFGTGYSSLSYLKTLPIQRLKLDRSFVKDIETDPDDKAICTATIALAHSLGLEVVAEGVETQEQHAFLLSRGCDLMQGYLFGRPLPVDEATHFIAAARGPVLPAMPGHPVHTNGA